MSRTANPSPSSDRGAFQPLCMSSLSISEITAENMYNLLRSGRMGRKAFIHNFKNLAKREDNIGAFYLTWLLAKSNNKYVLKLLMDSIKALNP